MLPIDALRADFERALAAGPVVISAPTGSGKSTQVPRWIQGRCVVVEPRRVACRSLAARIAELEGEPLGRRVGYRVRDDARVSDETRILFVTPGIALRDAALLESADVVILDELHERRMDVDLLLGFCVGRPGLIAMSATLDGDRVAAHLGGVHLEGEGRVFPVDILHRGPRSALPTHEELSARVVDAIFADGAAGDTLVFLPGRAEIGDCEARLAGRSGLDVVPLHGGLSLEQQARAFRKSQRRKVVLATNVAETSITIDGIERVIDSGLVRRTRYHQGRGFLTRTPIARDSAEQRAGRAGRTRAGVCVRLWGEAAILEPQTPPEVHRESVVPLLLGAAALGRELEELALLDPPMPHAVEDAREELRQLGAIDETGAPTALGRELHRRPLDPPLARLLIEAERQPELLRDVIDLVAVLSVGRSLFVDDERRADDLREEGCDVTAALLAMRRGDPSEHGLNAFVLREARRAAQRLARAHDLDDGPERSIDRRALALLFMAADPRLAHVVRRRGRKLALANGGTEVQLGRGSAAWRKADQNELEAALVLETRAFGRDQRRTTVVATCVMPTPMVWLRDGGVGTERVGAVRLARGVVWATLERVHVKRVLDTREVVPEGAAAREAMRQLIVEGRFLKKGRAEAADILAARDLAAQLQARGVAIDGVPIVAPGPSVDLETFLTEQLVALGVESGRDAKLLADDDLLPEPLDPWMRQLIDREYPRTVDAGPASYAVEYTLSKRLVTLRRVRGRKDTPPPPLRYLPRFEGLKVVVETHKSIHTLRER